MVGSPHQGKFGHRHMAADAFAAFAADPVMGMGSGIMDLVLVTRQTSVISPRFLPEPIASARRVALQAIQFAGLHARAHPPAGHRVVLAQVTPVRVEIGILQGDEVEVIEKRRSRLKSGRDRRRLGVT